MVRFLHFGIRAAKYLLLRRLSSGIIRLHWLLTCSELYRKKKSRWGASNKWCKTHVFWSRREREASNHVKMAPSLIVYWFIGRHGGWYKNTSSGNWYLNRTLAYVARRNCNWDWSEELSRGISKNRIGYSLSIRIVKPENFTEGGIKYKHAP